MSVLRVSIHRMPRLYSDLLTATLQSIEWIELVEDIPAQASSRRNGHKKTVDVILYLLQGENLSELEALCIEYPHSKILAFCPQGTYGLKHLPGMAGWVEVRPFRLLHILMETMKKPAKASDVEAYQYS